MNQKGVLNGVRLVKREIDVLACLARGLTTRQIAAELYYAEGTIENMLGRNNIDRGIYRKIGVKNGAEAAAWFGRTTANYELLKKLGETYVTRISQIRLRGLSQDAVEWAIEADRILRAGINNDVIAIGADQSLHRLRVKILYEHIIALIETAMPTNVLPLTKPVIRELRSIGEREQDDNNKQYPDQENIEERILALADYAEGLAYYVSGHYQTSIRYLQSAMEQARKKDTQLNILRFLGLDLAGLHQPEAFDEVAQQTKAWISKEYFFEPHLVCMAWEGLGRGQGLLNDTRAFDTINKGWNLYRLATKNGKYPLRYIQLVRSQLEIATSLNSIERFQMEQKARVGIQKAKEYGYPRYERQLETLMEQAFH